MASAFFKAIFTQRLSLYPQYAIFLGSAPKETNIADLSEIMWRFLPTAETIVIFSRKTRYRIRNWSITPHTLPFTRCFLRRRIYSLWGSTPAQNHQLPQATTLSRRVCSVQHISAISAAQCVQEKRALPTEHKGILRQPRYTTSAAKYP